MDPSLCHQQVLKTALLMEPAPFREQLQVTEKQLLRVSEGTLFPGGLWHWSIGAVTRTFCVPALLAPVPPAALPASPPSWFISLVPTFPASHHHQGQCGPKESSQLLKYRVLRPTGDVDLGLPVLCQALFYLLDTIYLPALNSIRSFCDRYCTWTLLMFPKWRCGGGSYCKCIECILYNLKWIKC